MMFPRLAHVALMWCISSVVPAMAANTEDMRTELSSLSGEDNQDIKETSNLIVDGVAERFAVMYQVNMILNALMNLEDDTVNIEHQNSRRSSFNEPINVANQNSPSNLGNSRSPSQYKEDKYKPSNLTDAWTTGETLGPYEDWQKNAETILASGATEFFGNWTEDYDTIDSHNCKGRSLGSMACFAFEYWGEPNFHCTIDKTEACRMPNGQEIMNHVKKNWPKYSAEEQVDLGRKIYFTARNYHAIIWNIGSIHNIIDVAKSQVALKVPAMIKDFSPQKDKMQAAKCEIAKLAIKMIVDLLLDSLNVATTFMAGPIVSKWAKSDGLAAWFDAAGKFRKEWVQVAAKLPPQIGKIVLSNTWTGVKTRKELEKIMENAKDKTKSGGFGPLPNLELHLTQAKGLCGNNFAVAEDDTAQNTLNTVRYVQEYLEQTRRELDVSFRSLVEYKEGADSSHLGHLMDMMYMQPDKLPGVYQETRQKFINSFEAQLISKISAASQCYAKCEQRPDAAELCMKDAKSGHQKTRQSRYCPPDHSNIRCQAACWTKQAALNKEKYLYGLTDAWAKYNISTERLLGGSWTHYQMYGTNDSLISHPMINGERIQETDDVLHLPVCLSKVKTIEDIGDEKRRKKFPWSCGSYRSEESSAFIKSINVHLDQAPNMVKTNLAEHLKIVRNPANSFILLCRLNVRWPFHHHRGKPTDTLSHPDIVGELKGDSHDPRCEQVMAATEGMDEETANTHFCKMPAVTHGVFKDERNHLDSFFMNAGGPYNSKQKCKSWMKYHI